MNIIKSIEIKVEEKVIPEIPVTCEDNSQLAKCPLLVLVGGDMRDEFEHRII